MRIEYYPAGENVLLIFTGLGGTASGFRNKYVKIAENAVRKYKFSVFVAEVPENCWDNPEKIFTEAVEYALAVSKAETVYIMGNSAGANLAIWYSHLYPQIKKILAVNAVLNLNFHKTKNGLQSFSGENIFVFIGGNDPSAKYCVLLPEKDNAEYKILDGIDHTFSNNLSVFINLPEITLFN